jgi:hypothetical protein
MASQTLADSVTLVQPDILANGGEAGARVLVDKAALKPHERDAILWLLASFDQPASPREGGSSQATL